MSPVLSGPAQTFNLYTPQLTISYVPDLFGGTRRTVESAEAQAHAQEFALRAAHLTLASNVALAAIQYASLSDQLAAQQKITDSAEQPAGPDAGPACARRHQQGGAGVAGCGGDAGARRAGGGSETAGAADRSSGGADRPAAGRLSSRRSSAWRSCRCRAKRRCPCPPIWCASAPMCGSRKKISMPPMPQVGVAIAAMLPNITLSATGGSAATAIGQLFGPGTSFWSIGANVAQTLFDGGALLAKKRAAEAALDQAKAQYQSAVTTAFQNTADALEAVHYDADALAANAAAGAAATEALARARRQQALGDTGMPAVLLAEQSRSAGADRADPGPGHPLCRYRRAVPGAGRRLVEQAGPALNLITSRSRARRRRYSSASVTTRRRRNVSPADKADSGS